MRHENALGNRQVVILDDDVDIGFQIDEEAAAARLPIAGKFAPRRVACLWIGAAILATLCTSEVRGSSRYPQVGAPAHAQLEIAVSEPGFRGSIRAFRVESALSNTLTAKPVRLAQAALDNPEDLQKALEQEHDRAELLVRELAIHRHLEMLLTLNRARSEAASSKQFSESEHTELQEDLQQERTRLKQAAERGGAELCKVLSDGQSERPAGTTDLVALRTSLQQEQERSDRLKQDLATARHDLALQTALVSRANEEANQAKAQAEKNAAEPTKSFQQERERAEQLEKDLGDARRDVATQMALVSKAHEEADQAKRSAENAATGLRTSLQREGERAGQLEKDLAAARRDVETQTALVSKASRDATQLKQVADSEAANLKQSLQKEHERAEALTKELSTAHTAIYAYEAQAHKTSDQVAEARQAGENSVAALQKSLQQEQGHAKRLEQDVAAARRDVETQTALVAQVREDAARSKQASDNGVVELKRSLQQEHDRAEALAQNLSLVHTAIYTYEVQARMANDQAAARARSTAGSAAELRKLLLQEQARTAQLEQSLAASRRDVETRTALVEKARVEAVRLKHAADNSSAEFLNSLQQERDKAARLERELAAERKPKDVPVAAGVVTAARVTQVKELAADPIKPLAMNQAPAAAARSNATPVPQSAAEITTLVARASLLLGRGDIGSARSVLERAAETGNAQASFALAETYDPLVLRKWGAYGTLGDAAKARDLYARAQAGGVKDAKERLDALRR